MLVAATSVVICCALSFFFSEAGVCCLTQVLSAVSEAGQFEVAIRLVQQMRAAGGTPSKVSLVDCHAGIVSSSLVGDAIPLLGLPPVLVVNTAMSVIPPRLATDNYCVRTRLRASLYSSATRTLQRCKHAAERDSFVRGAPPLVRHDQLWPRNA